MAEKRPSRLAIAVQFAALALTAVAAVLEAPNCNWDLPLFFVLLAFSVFSYLTAVSTESKVKVSGAFLALVLAMVFLGGTPAALIGVATNAIGWIARWKDEPHYLLNNILTYAIFPLIGGFAFREAVVALELTSNDVAFYLLVFGLFQFSLLINFVLVAGYRAYVERASFASQLHVLPPVLPSEFA